MAKKSTPSPYAGAEPNPAPKNQKGKKLPAFLAKGKASPAGKGAAAVKPKAKSKGRAKKR